jgi:putative transposase
MDEFNSLEPVGSLYLNRFKKRDPDNVKLVDFVAYCLNPNHYHFILTPLVENGIERFMQRLGTGFTMFFNERYERNGVLFQGKFKAVHIDSDEYLMYLNVYVNLNDKAHSLGGSTSKWITKSSWNEYIGENKENFCNKKIVLDRFNSPKEYKEFAEETLKGVLERKEELRTYFIE